MTARESFIGFVMLIVGVLEGVLLMWWGEC